jgi:hypothetical protein
MIESSELKERPEIPKLPSKSPTFLFAEIETRLFISITQRCPLTSSLMFYLPREIALAALISAGISLIPARTLFAAALFPLSSKATASSTTESIAAFTNSN